MKLKKHMPEQELLFTNTDPFTVDLLLTTLRHLGVNVYDSSKEYDPQYPYVVWDRGYITQTRGATHPNYLKVSTIEEFIKHFVSSKGTKTITLSDDYNAHISQDEVKVGCQTIPYKMVKEIWDTMNELRSE